MRPQSIELMNGLRGAFQDAQLASHADIRRNAHQLEDLLRRHQEGKIDDADLLDEIDARRAVLRRFLRTRNPKPGGRMERLTLGLLDALRAKIVGRIPYGCASTLLAISQEFPHFAMV